KAGPRSRSPSPAANSTTTNARTRRKPKPSARYGGRWGDEAPCASRRKRCKRIRMIRLSMRFGKCGGEYRPASITNPTRLVAYYLELQKRYQDRLLATTSAQKKEDP